MMLQLVWILFSLLLLFAGAEFLVRGSSAIAIRAGLSPLMVGLTIVAFGTSSPELVVSLKAALAGQGDISVGNVVGSNSFNIGIILGITALICPVPVHLQIIRLDAPVALTVAMVLPLFLLDGMIGRAEGMLLFAGIVGYTLLNVRMARSASRAETGDDGTVSGPLKKGHWLIDTGLVVGGLGILVLGSNLLVDNAVALAASLGVSQAVIGLTIVAAGTSMPELATSLVAAFRKQPDIAIGNIVGSNIFNVLGILGAAAITSPISAPGISPVDYGFMIGFSLLLLPLLYTGRMLHRIEGVLLLAVYGGYLWVLWP